MTTRSDLDDFLEEELRDPESRAIWDAMMPRVEFGFALGRAREQRRMSLKRLAEATEIDRATLHRLEVGDEEPTVLMQTKLAHALNARIEIGASGRIEFMLLPQPVARRESTRLNAGARTLAKQTA